MSASLKEQVDQVFLNLKKTGFLMLADASLPSVTGLVTGERLRGSWWSHKKAQTIFAVNERLEDHPDVLIMKLISGKVTFVHRELWAAVYSIGTAREAWQLQKLTPGAKLLLKTLDTNGALQTNELGKTFGPRPGDIARELELRLLLHSSQIHTESGAHAQMLETWDAWAKRAGFNPRKESPSAARCFLEERLSEINKNHDGKGRLPWPANT